jgi:hypothetical protein
VLSYSPNVRRPFSHPGEARNEAAMWLETNCDVGRGADWYTGDIRIGLMSVTDHLHTVIR